MEMGGSLSSFFRRRRPGYLRNVRVPDGDRSTHGFVETGAATWSLISSKSFSCHVLVKSFMYHRRPRESWREL